MHGLCHANFQSKKKGRGVPIKMVITYLEILYDENILWFQNAKFQELTKRHNF